MRHFDRKRKGDHQRSDSRPRRVPVERVPKNTVGVSTRNRRREKSKRQLWAEKAQTPVAKVVETSIVIIPVPETKLVIGLEAAKVTEALATM